MAPSLFEAIGSALATLDKIFVRISSAALFATMIVMTLDVVFRYFANAPLLWVHDLVALYLLGGVFFFGVTSAMRHGDHIAVDLVYNAAPVKVREAMAVVSYLVSAAVFAVFLWVAVRQTYISFMADEEVAGLIPWPVWLSNAAAPFGFAAILMLCLYRLGASVAALAGIELRDTSAPSHGPDQ